MNRPMYEIFEHTADVGLRVRAPDLDSLFSEAAEGLFSLVMPNLEDLRTTEQVTIRLEGQNTEDLLVDWLTELLVLLDTRRLLLSDFSVTVDSEGLQATARGEVFDSSRHQLEHELKAITYHGLRVERYKEGWIAEVIIDI